MSASLEPVCLPLRLGEITLSDLWLCMSVDKTHFLDNHDPDIPHAAKAMGDGHLVRSCPLDKPLPRLSFFNGYVRYVPTQYRRHYIDLSIGWESYQSQFSSKSRQTLRRKIRKFAEASNGRIDWRCYTRPEDLTEFYALAREVSKVTYQERLLDAGLPDNPKFVERSRQLASMDRLRAYLLFLNAEPVAYLYCPVQDGVLLYEYLGYTPSAASLSPGTVLQWFALESLFVEGRFRVFDFSEGDGSHKAYFGSDHQICADLYLLKPRARPIAVALSHATVTAFSDGGTWVADRLGLKQRVKRMIRRF